MPAHVVEDHAAPGAGQRLDPGREDPVDGVARSEPVDQQDRLAAVGARRGLVEIGEAHPVRRGHGKHGRLLAAPGAVRLVAAHTSELASPRASQPSSRPWRRRSSAARARGR